LNAPYFGLLRGSKKRVACIGGAVVFVMSEVVGSVIRAESDIGGIIRSSALNVRRVRKGKFGWDMGIACA
jgi:hypothetical protein